MRSLWAKIGLGALGVFAVGMLLVTVGGEVRAAATTAVHQAVARSVSQVAGQATAPSDMPFVLDGDRLGSIRHLTIQRFARNETPKAALEVELTDAATLGRLATCDLAPEDDEDLDFDHGFRCLEPGARHQVQVGTVRFQPGAMERPIMLPESSLGDARKGDPFRVDVQAGGEVKVEASGDDAGLVRVLADHHGANIKVNDAMGRALVRLLADQNGAALRIRDDQGREIVRLDASDGHFSLSVDTSGVH